MTDKLLKIFDSTTLILLGFLTAASLLFPVFSNPDLGLIYSTCMVLAGLIFVMSNKLLKEELKIETPIDVNLIVLFAWQLVCSITGRNVFSALNSAVAFIIFLLFFYIAYNYAKKYFTAFLFFLIIVVAIMSVYGLYQYFAGFNETLRYLGQANTPDIDAIKERLYSKRVFSTLIYPNTFAGLLIMVIPVVVGLIKSEKKYRPYLIAALMLLAANLVLTRSVGAFVCLITGTFIMLLFVSDPGLKNFRRIFMALTLIAAVLLAIVLKMRGLNMVIPEINSKLENWIRMADIIKHSPVFGFGPGSFESVYNDPLFGKAQYLKYGHNFLLQAWMETGFVGVVLLLLAGYGAYSSIIKNFYYLRTPNKKILVFSMLTGLTAFLLHNLVDFDIYSFEVTVVFLILLAALMSQVNIGLIQLKKVKLSYLLGINPGRRRSLIFLVVLLVLLLCAVTGGKQTYVFTGMTVLITAGFAMWSVSKEDIRRTAVDVPLLLFLLWCGISLLFTPVIYSGIKLYTIITAGTVLYYLSSQFLRRLNFRAVIANTIIFLGAFLAVAACGQYLYNYFTHNYSYYRPVHTDGFFPNSSLYAAYISISFCFLLCRILLEKNIRFALAKGALVLLIIGAISLSVSKSGMLTMLAVFMGIAAYYLRSAAVIKDTPRHQLYKRLFLIFVLSALIFATFSPFTPAGDKMAGIARDPYSFNRLGIYKASFKMGLASPLTGWGLGSFESIFQAFNFPVNGIARYKMTTPFAHNEYLQVFAETGIPGALLAGFLLFALMRKIPVYEGHKKLWSIKTAAYFSIGGILFHSLFYFTLHLPGILFTCAVLASFISEERYSIRTVSREALLFTKIYFLPALLLSFIIFFLSIRPAAAYFLYTQYSRSGNPDLLHNAALVDPLNSLYYFEKGLVNEKSGNLRGSIPYFERAVRLDRKNCIYMLHAARANAGTGDNVEALKYYNMAIEANPYRAFTYSELAGFYMTRLNDPEKAELNLKKSLEIEPMFLEAINNLALIYKSRKQYGAALLLYDKMDNIIRANTALDDYEKGILGIPYFSVLRSKAYLYAAQGMKKDACAWYLKSLADGGPGARTADLENYCTKAAIK